MFFFTLSRRGKELFGAPHIWSTLGFRLVEISNFTLLLRAGILLGSFQLLYRQNLEQFDRSDKLAFSQMEFLGARYGWSALWLERFGAGAP